MNHPELVLTGKPISSSYQNLLQFSGSGPTSTLVKANGDDFDYTASWATNAINGGTTLTTGSTYPITSSWAVNAINGGAQLLTGSTYPITASFAVSASWAPFTDTGTTLYTGSTYEITSSWARSAISANVPTSSTDIATKGYVDGLFQGNAIFYLSSTGSGVGTDYILKLSGSSPTSVSLSTSSVGNNTYVFSWITPPSIPNVTILPDGLYHIDHTSRKTAATNTVTIFPELYIADSLGVEYFEIGTVSTPFTLTDTFERVQQNILVDTPITTSATDRLVIKLKITNTGTNDIETIVEGTTLSHFATPISNANFIINVNTASVAISASYASTASWAINAINGGTTIITGSTYPITASWALTASAFNSISGSNLLYLQCNDGNTYPVTLEKDGTTVTLAIGQSPVTGSNNFLNIGTISAGISSSWASSSLSSSYALTASFALNGVSSVVAYTTIVTSSTKWITCSFDTSEQWVDITLGQLYNFTSSNHASVGYLKDVILLFNNTAVTTSSLSFPATWKNQSGGWPTSITSSKTATLALRSYGPNTVVGSWITEI